MFSRQMWTLPVGKSRCRCWKHEMVHLTSSERTHTRTHFITFFWLHSIHQMDFSSVIDWCHLQAGELVYGPPDMWHIALALEEMRNWSLQVASKLDLPWSTTVEEGHCLPLSVWSGLNWSRLHVIVILYLFLFIFIYTCIIIMCLISTVQPVASKYMRYFNETKHFMSIKNRQRPSSRADGRTQFAAVSRWSTKVTFSALYRSGGQSCVTCWLLCRDPMSSWNHRMKGRAMSHPLRTWVARPALCCCQMPYFMDDPDRFLEAGQKHWPELMETHSDTLAYPHPVVMPRVDLKKKSLVRGAVGILLSKSWKRFEEVRWRYGLWSAKLFHS